MRPIVNSFPIRLLAQTFQCTFYLLESLSKILPFQFHQDYYFPS